MTLTDGGGAAVRRVPVQRVLVTGASGQLGRDLRAALAGGTPDGGAAGLASTGRLGSRRPAEVLATDVVVSDGVQALDITDRAAVLAAADGFRPDVILHGAAFTQVDACEGDPDRAFAVNSLATRHVAEAARSVGAHLVYVSTDYVFDGSSPRPYVEWDAPNPQSMYGRSKLGGELEVGPESTIVRTSWVSGAHGANMVHTALRLAAGDAALRFVDDQRGCPTFTADLAGALLVLAEDRRPGIFHVTNQGPTTWFEFVRAVLEVSGGDPGRVSPISSADLDPERYPAPRPANSVLDNAALRLSGLDLLPDWHDALDRLVRHLQVGASA